TACCRWTTSVARPEWFEKMDYAWGVVEEADGGNELAAERSRIIATLAATINYGRRFSGRARQGTAFASRRAAASAACQIGPRGLAYPRRKAPLSLAYRSLG